MEDGKLIAVIAATMTERERLLALIATAAEKLTAQRVTGSEKSKHHQEICPSFSQEHGNNQCSLYRDRFGIITEN
jgi:hypothetical protein